jgi:hypothetical protein
MAKSTYADKFQAGMPLLKVIQDDQLGRLASLAPKYRRPQLDEWNDLAQAEAAVKERYQGRYLFELLQNANDAIVDRGGAAANSELDARVRIELTPRSLLVANCGQPFGELNVRALCRLHNTTKTASKQIGHKGIGFKSVLEICSAPQVFSDIYSFRFDGRQFQSDVEKIMGSGWKMQGALPTLRTPYPCYLNQVNPQDRKRIEDLLDDGFPTVVRLEWEDEGLATQVAARIAEDLHPSLLLFLTAIQRIEIALPDQPEQCLRREEHPTADTSMKEVLLYREAGDAPAGESRWLLLSPPERPVRDRSLVADLGEAWKDVQAARFALAIELDRLSGLPLLGGPSRPFYVYFPTQEYSGLRFIVHADFYVGDDRKTLPAVQLNEWLINEICGYLAGEGMDLLKREWRQGTDLIELLAPINRPEREFSRGFMECYLAWLRESPFVPIDGGHYKEPCNVRFPPRTANQARFRTLLPASRLRDSENWAYATTDVITAERERKRPFLLSPELGASEITAEQVIAALRKLSMPPIEQCEAVIALLAEWWEALPSYDKRPAFEKLLKSLPMFPTGRGWLRADEATIFQANLRPGVADVPTPPGFDFAVIRRDAYPEAGSLSVQSRFFDKLGARNYAARDLIRDAVLPVMTSVERLTALATDNPESVLAAYRMIFQYYRDERGSRDMADRLGRVLLPAWGAREQDASTWKAATECYLGAVWPDGQKLETVFAGFDDCFFVRELPGLTFADEQERTEWGSFLGWLGVQIRPKLIEAHYPTNAASTDPFGNAGLWRQYLDARRKDWRCVTDTRHGSSRYLTDVYALHHFSEMAASGDAARLSVLFELLAANWASYYSRYGSATARCDRERCQRDPVENHFLFALQRLAWLPATLGSHEVLLAPRDIWDLGETESQDVRSLLPVLQPGLTQRESRDLRVALRFISSSTAQIEDYVRLLGFLAEHYPRAAWPPEFEERRRNPLTTTFNWALERIQTGLVGRSNAPECPAGLGLLASVDGGLDYIAREDPCLVYGDDPFMEGRWRTHCAFLRVNEDWQRLRDWLGVPHLSTVVRAGWTVGTEREEETRGLDTTMNEVLPFLAALVAKRQPTVYERILPRLNRLEVHIVDSLTITETIDRLTPPVELSTPASVYLRLQEETRFRAGSLFCTAEVLENPNLLGDHIAGYIEIAGLSDAFVLLMHLDQAGRERYVESKGVTSEMLQRARTDLGEPEPDSLSATEVIARIVSRTIQETTPAQIAATGTSSSGGGAGPEKSNENGASGGTGGGTIIHVAKDYPPLDTAAATPAVPAIERPPITKNPPAVHGSGGGGTTLTLTSEEAKEQLGKRGEEWVYASEKRRLAAMDVNPEEAEKSGLLAWVSAGRPGSPFDIRSLDEQLNEVFIEVKSSSDRNPVIHLSITELAFALEHGERYWLYWVGSVAATQPDPPEYYRDFARWLREKKVTVDVDSLNITLRKPSTG